MKILITGGAGFIGSHIADAYIAAGHEIVVVDDLSTGKKEFVNHLAKFYRADLRRGHDIAQIIRKERPEIINHQAAQKSVARSVSDPLHDAQINVIGFLHLMKAAKNASVKKVIFASTGGAIYGATNNIPTPETETPHPISPYAITKYTTENYLNFYFTICGITPVILRYSNVYGPRQDPMGEAGVVAIFSKKIAQDQPILVFGDGKQTRDYVYVGDVAQANLQALNYTPRNFGEVILNIGTGIETPLNHIIHYLSQVSGKQSGIQYQPARQGDLLRSAIANDKAKQYLHWQPQVPLQQGITETYKYFSDSLM